MTKVELSFEISDQLARDARQAGLLAPEAIAEMVASSVRRKAAERIRQSAARGSACGEPPMSLADIQKVVDSVRKGGG